MIKKGVTLIELVVVLAILGIIINFVSFNNNISTYLLLKNEFSALKDDIKYIQKISSYNNRRCYIRLYHNKNYYDVYLQNENQNYDKKTIYLSSKISFKKQTTIYHDIVFTKTGTLSSGSSSFYMQYKDKKIEFAVLFPAGFVNT